MEKYYYSKVILKNGKIKTYKKKYRTKQDGRGRPKITETKINEYLKNMSDINKQLVYNICKQLQKTTEKV